MTTMCLNHARVGRDDLINKVTFEQQFEGDEGVDPDREEPVQSMPGATKGE